MRSRGAAIPACEQAAASGHTRGGNIMHTSTMTRRRFLTMAATSALIAAPYVRGAHAAGKLSVGFWDHWVPGANSASQALCEEWGAREKVEVSIDYITSQ